MSPTIYPDPTPPQRPDPTPEVPRDPMYLEEDTEWESPFASKLRREQGAVHYRGTTSDPVFGYLVAMALGIGLMPLIPDQIDLRYALVWTVMAGFGVMAWLLGTSARIWTESLENLSWGVVFGLIVGLPMLMVGGVTLRETAQRLFTGMSLGSVLAFLVFVIPLAETLFFRGVLQEGRSFWLVSILSSLWSFVVFFPMLDVRRYPGPVVIIGTALVMMNVIYAYVRRRNGLAAAWLCQIVVHVLLLFLPLL